MKTGTAIAKTVRPFVKMIDLSLGTNIAGCRGCHQMERDFNNAEHFSDYTKAVLDRLYKRGNYKQQK